MTVEQAKISKKDFSARRSSFLSFIKTSAILIFALFTSLFLSEQIALSVKGSLLLCANVIVPSVFPFIILSDFLYCFVDFTSMRKLGDLFEKLFKINRAGLYPFILGILCGFPIGVRCASELYADGRISRDECERLIGFCNNTGPAFLVCGIGMGLRNSLSDGIALYVISVLSAIFTGVIFSFGKSAEKASEFAEKQSRFSITESIRNAGMGCLNICSYLTFFSCIAGVIRYVFKDSFIYLSLIPFLEVGGATEILSKTELIGAHQSLALSAFAVGFSGFSVHLQALSFLADTDIRTSRYFIMKTTQGLLSAVMAFAVYYLYN